MAHELIQTSYGRRSEGGVLLPRLVAVSEVTLVNAPRVETLITTKLPEAFVAVCKELGRLASGARELGLEVPKGLARSGRDDLQMKLLQGIGRAMSEGRDYRIRDIVDVSNGRWKYALPVAAMCLSELDRLSTGRKRGLDAEVARFQDAARIVAGEAVGAMLAYMPVEVRPDVEVRPVTYWGILEELSLNGDLAHDPARRN